MLVLTAFPSPPQKSWESYSLSHRHCLTGATAIPGSSAFPARCPQNMSDWASLWLLLLTLFLLLLCGLSASCVRFCCRRKRLPVETFPRHPCDLAGIGIDSDSTAHSTVTSYSSWQYPPSVQIPAVFVDMDKNTLSPPAYSVYALDLPPSYDEAVQMGKPGAEGARKLSDIPEQGTPAGLSPSQDPPETATRDPAAQPTAETSQGATKEQPQI
ncbi:transmembrane protein 52 isoform X2 [Empidonax traillii]|uniref:transmembrane protein 52 isoform X2 n=1 Tax=Empidonax traillii TaxID=164674 RepID=UPI000FFD8816|nr:transmembrane protein 52 isoform X2 [Empidonax traillii]